MSAISVDPIGGFFERWKNSLTSRMSGRKDVPYRSIQEVLEDPNSAKALTLKDKFKWGHFWCAFDLVLGGAFGYFAKKIDSNFWKYLFGFFSITDIAAGVVNGVVGTFCKNDLEEKMKKFIPAYVEKEGKPNYDLSQVVISKDDEAALKLQIDEARRRGVVINIYGPIGNGKTMTGRGMAGELVKQGICKNAQYWNAKEEFLKVEAVDKWGGPFSFLGIQIVDGETIIQRIERVVASALAHYRQTGEYVVLGLDEAHILLEGHETLWDHRTRRSTTNPKDRPDLIQAFAKLVDKAQDKNGDCKGVILMVLSNSAGNKFKFLERRMLNMEFKRPDFELRKRFLEHIVPKMLAKHKVNNVTLSPGQYHELAEIGTENIHKRYEKISYVGSNGTEYKDDNTPNYMRPYIAELKNFDVLRFDAIEKAVDETIFQTKSGDTSILFQALKGKLTKLCNEAANDLKQWQDEYKDKAGVDRNSFSYYL